MAKEMNYEALQANLRMIDKKGEMAYEQARANGTLTPEQEKFSSLISDEAFAEKFLSAESAEQAAALFKANGLELSEEEVTAFGKYIVSVSKKLIENGGELSENEMEQIAGGFLGIDANTSPGDAFGMELGGALGVLGGGLSAGAAGLKIGAAIGTVICPGPGSGIGAVVGTVIGVVGGAVGGGVGGWKLGAKLAKLGLFKWVKY